MLPRYLNLIQVRGLPNAELYYRELDSTISENLNMKYNIHNYRFLSAYLSVDANIDDFNDAVSSIASIGALDDHEDDADLLNDDHNTQRYTFMTPPNRARTMQFRNSHQQLQQQYSALHQDIHSEHGQSGDHSLNVRINPTNAGISPRNFMNPGEETEFQDFESSHINSDFVELSKDERQFEMVMRGNTANNIYSNATTTDS